MAEEVKVTLPEGTTPEQVEKMLQKMFPKNLKETQNLVFKKWEAGPNKELQIERTFFKGRQLLSIRKWWREDETQEFKPGKGVTFGFEDIEEIIEGLQAMLNYFEDHPEEHI